MTKPKPNAAPTKQLLTKFDQLHRERFNRPAVILAGRDAQTLARLHKTHAEYIEPLMELFFTERDSFVESRGHTIGIFASQFARLLKQQAAATTAATKSQAYWDKVYEWREDCLRLHDGECESWRAHDHRVAKDALRAAGEI